MKFCAKVWLLVLCILFASNKNAVGHSLGAKMSIDGEFAVEQPMGDINSLSMGTRLVYLCMGRYSYAYHSHPDCPGLNNCQGITIVASEFSATYTYGRIPCCFCWMGVSRCAKDGYWSYLTGNGKKGWTNGGNGGISGEALAVVAGIVLVTGLVLISNDMYFYPTLSMDQLFTMQSVSIGFELGLRKTFKRCAIEYGGLYGKRMIPYTNYDGIGDMDSFGMRSDDVWGGKISFVHQILWYSTPPRIKLYGGISGNFINDAFGYGGIVGCEWQILDRLKMDCRYELTTTTNQFAVGMIFKYQKKYLWQNSNDSVKKKKSRRR